MVDIIQLMKYHRASREVLELGISAFSEICESHGRAGDTMSNYVLAEMKAAPNDPFIVEMGIGLLAGIQGHDILFHTLDPTLIKTVVFMLKLHIANPLVVQRALHFLKNMTWTDENDNRETVFKRGGMELTLQVLIQHPIPEIQGPACWLLANMCMHLISSHNPSRSYAPVPRSQTKSTSFDPPTPLQNVLRHPLLTQARYLARQALTTYHSDVYVRTGAMYVMFIAEEHSLALPRLADAVLELMKLRMEDISHDMVLPRIMEEVYEYFSTSEAELDSLLLGSKFLDCIFYGFGLGALITFDDLVLQVLSQPLTTTRFNRIVEVLDSATELQHFSPCNFVNDQVAINLGNLLQHAQHNTNNTKKTNTNKQQTQTTQTQISKKRKTKISNLLCANCCCC